MARKSEINIFKVMSEEELGEMIKINAIGSKFYQRLIAMRLFSRGLSLSEIARILEVSYPSVYRWAKSCEMMGIEGLKPSFNGGKSSDFSNSERKRFVAILKRKKSVTIKDAQKILKDQFQHDFSLVYVSELVRSLGFEYACNLQSFGENAPRTLVYVD